MLFERDAGVGAPLLGNESSIRTLAIAPRAHNAGSTSPMTSHHREAKEEKRKKLSLNFDSLKQKHKMMSTAGYPPARRSRSALLRRRHPLLPPSLLLLLASAFCWKGAAGQQIGCKGGGNYVQQSATTENFFDALSGDGVDFYKVWAPRIHAWMLLFPTTRRCQTPRPPSVHRSFFSFPLPIVFIISELHFP